MLRWLRSALNISLLFSALVLTPLLALSHFNAPLAAMLSNISGKYLPNPTLLQKQSTARRSAESKLQKQRVTKAQKRANTKRVARHNSKMANKRGKRVLVRGAGAMLIGWVPVIGVTADVVSLSEDYSDICQMFAVMDELLGMLYLPESNLYRENYCHVPEQGLEIIKTHAQETEFPWELDESE